MTDDLFDPKRLIRRSEIEACAAITRVHTDGTLECEPHRYVGLLLGEVQVGVPLVLLLDKKRRLVTSTVHRIDAGSADTVYVDTENSRYCVRRLIAPLAVLGPWMRPGPLECSMPQLDEQWSPMTATGVPPRVTPEQRELLLFDALRVALGFVHGAEREQVQQSLRTAGLIRHLASDGCESWHWPGREPLGGCRHGCPFRREEVG